MIERPAAGVPWRLPTWLPTRPRLLPAANGGPAVLLNRRGDALAWWRAAGLFTLVSSALRSFVSPRTGAGWRAARGDIALPGASSRAGIQLAVEGGHALVAWRTEGANASVRASLRADGGAGWEAPRTIGGPAAGAPSAALGPMGNVAVAWVREASRGGGVEVTLRSSIEGWRTPETVSGPGTQGAAGVRVSVDGDGSLRAATGAWEMPQTLVTQPAGTSDGGRSPLFPSATPVLRGGRAFVPWGVHGGLSLSVRRSGMWVRDGAAPGWREEQPFDLPGDGFVHSAVADDGSALTVDFGNAPARTARLGLAVREFTARPRPAPTRVSRLGLSVRGRRTTVAFTLSRGGFLVGSAWIGSHRRGGFGTPLFPAGRHEWSFPIRPGVDRIELAVCGWEACRNLAQPLSPS